jgi:hypothetical protein
MDQKFIAIKKRLDQMASKESVKMMTTDLTQMITNNE